MAVNYQSVKKYGSLGCKKFEVASLSGQSFQNVSGAKQSNSVAFMAKK